MSEKMRRGISSVDGEKWSDGEDLAWRADPDESVERIVIGSLEQGAAITLPEDFINGLAGNGKGKLNALAGVYPHLKCLHLWGLKGVRTIGSLPTELVELDVRNCPKLEKVDDLPPDLEILVLGKSPSIKDLPSLENRKLLQLKELEINDCLRIDEAWIHSALAKSLDLRKLDASGCAQLSCIKAWPRKLKDVRLNRCRKLKALPKDYWPKTLRRIELEDTSLSEIAEFGNSFDYVNLAGMSKLLSFRHPSLKDRGAAEFPRTLFLQGSGVKVPPASEHGDTRESNVAQSVREYFDDIAICGKGEVHRCKVLFLGNGEAGKTCVSLALDESVENPAEAALELGSTHGVQFWPHEEEANIGGMTTLAIDYWDFGGQEIYHNTHRLFMGTGSIFVVLWKPSQIGRQPPFCQKSGYQDKWRPLRYWLDLIHLSAESPEVIVACSHCSELTEEIKRLYKKERGAGYDDVKLVAIDSADRTGDIEYLRTWISENAKKVVEAQGTLVPAYWEIAASMVTMWTKELSNSKDQSFLESHREMGEDDFRKRLVSEVREVAQGDARFARLADAIDEDEDYINLERTRRALQFLTHSGALYWDLGLFNERVIVGQQWALDGIYTVLDRRKESTIFQKLWGANGRFTQENLASWVWEDCEETYSSEQQSLLISFMEKCGVCFRIVDKENSYWRNAVYVSLEHLQSGDELGLTSRYNETASRGMNLKPEWIRNPFYHEGLWKDILRTLGNEYGADAEYASDAFFLPENEEGQALWVHSSVEEDGIGGKYLVEVSGPDSDRLQKELEEKLAAGLPNPKTGKMSRSGMLPFNIISGPKLVHVFVSYARNDKGRVGDHIDYEEAVDYIESRLAQFTNRIEFIRDKNIIRDGDSIPEFMDNAAQMNKVLVVTSDKYWRSEYCMYEFWRCCQDTTEIEKKFVRLILPDPKEDDFEAQEKFWKDFKEEKLSKGLRKAAKIRSLQSGIFDAICNKRPELEDKKNVRIGWDPAKADEIVKWLVERLGFKTGPSESETYTTSQSSSASASSLRRWES